MAQLKTGLFLCVALASVAMSAPADSPTIYFVGNNYGQIPSNLPGYGLAPSTLFIIKGSGLASATSGLQSSANPGLQTTLQGVTVTVNAGGKMFACPLYYLSPTQIDAVLPGTTPVGSATLIVTNNAISSAPYSFNVVASGFGILTYSGILAAAYHPDGSIITSAKPARLNETIVLWGSGVGYDPNDDDKLFPQEQDNLTDSEMEVLVGGFPASIPYRGRSQFPGLDQVVITIPAFVQTGCYVSIAVVNTTPPFASTMKPVGSATLPIASDDGACSDDSTELTPDIEQKLGQKSSVNLGFLSLLKTIASRPRFDGQSGVFFILTSPSAWFSQSVPYSSLASMISPGSCVVSYSSSSAIRTTALDAGPFITVTGPAGVVKLPLDRGIYDLSQGAPLDFLPNAGGVFTFDNGAAGEDVPHFSATLTAPAAFTRTDPPITDINRAVGVPVFWNGGDAGTYMIVSGSSGAGTSSSATFSCSVPASAGKFTVPFYILQALPPGQGTLSVTNQNKFRVFNAPGLDLGLTSISTTMQYTNISYR